MEKICGIYKITNQVNGKVYIGQSINIKRRWANHEKDAFWEKAECYNYPLYKAIRKYGLAYFDFEVVEECPREQLNEREMFYIQQYHSNEKRNGYNQTLGGDTQEHAKKLTDEDIDKILMRLKTSYDSANIICKEFGVSATLIRDINRGDVYRRDDETYPIRQKLYKLAGYYESQGRTAYSTSLTPVKRLRHPKTKTTSTTFIQKHQKIRIRKPTKLLKDVCPICGRKKARQATMCSTCWSEKKHQDNAIAQCPESFELAKLIIEKGFEAVGRDFGVSGKAIAKWCNTKGIPSKKNEILQWYIDHGGEPIQIMHNTQRHAQNTRHSTVLSAVAKDRLRPVYQVDIKTQRRINWFFTQNAAFKSLNIRPTKLINEVCLGRLESAYGYFWQYADE